MAERAGDDVVTERMSSIDFASAAREIGMLARRFGLKTPNYSGVAGGNYWVRRNAVHVDHARPEREVVLDMLIGLVDVNNWKDELDDGPF